MARVTVTIILTLAVLIGQFFLQYFLSLRESKWPGLVLPALSLLAGLIYTLSATTVPAAVAGFLAGGGIPFLLHLAVYFAGRGKVRRRRRDRVEKMNIQDL